MSNTAPGRLVGTGRDADVFDIGGGRVLRRYRHAQDTAHEAAMMRWVRSHGMPVPEVFDADGTDLVMARVDGAPLLHGLAAHPYRLPGVGRVLASLHEQLAAVPVADWMSRRYPGQSEGVVHCDLHPDNVMMSPDGPVLIDWTRSCAGDRGADLAHTWMILSCLGLPAGWLGRSVELVGRRVVAGTYLRAIDRARATAWMPRIAEDRMADKNTSDDERARMRRFV